MTRRDRDVDVIGDVAGSIDDDSEISVLESL